MIKKLAKKFALVFVKKKLIKHLTKAFPNIPPFVIKEIIDNLIRKDLSKEEELIKLATEILEKEKNKWR